MNIVSSVSIEHASEVLSCAITGGPVRLVVTATASQVAVWDTRTGQRLHAIKGRADLPLLAASPNDATIVVASTSLRLIEATSGSILVRMKGHGSSRETTDVQFHPHKQVIASCGGGDQISLWDAKSGERLAHRKLEGVHRIAFSPDGERLAAATAPEEIEETTDSPLFVLDALTLETIEKHDTKVALAIAWNAGGLFLSGEHGFGKLGHARIGDIAGGLMVTGLRTNRVAIAGEEGPVLIVEGDQVTTVPSPKRPCEEPWNTSLALSSDGSLLVRGCDKSVDVWELGA